MSSINGRLGTIQPGVQDKRGSDKFHLAPQTVCEITLLSLEGGPSFGEEVVKMVLKSEFGIVLS